MAFERRRNGRQYYYRSRREDGGVLKEYIGAGEAGRRAAEADQAARNLKIGAARRRQEKQRSIDELGQLLADLGRLVDRVVGYQLVSAGWKKHHRQWRPTVHGSHRNCHADV
jgi:hypothetical protein